MTENTAAPAEQAPNPQDAEISAMIEELMPILNNKPLQIVLPAVTTFLIAAAGDDKANEGERKIRASYILQRGLQAADAADLTTDEVVMAVMAVMPPMDVPEGVAEGVAAMLAAETEH